ncbi:MAG TPA: LPS export ABC transporter permease LptG [Beijerinckiaceae bacterium]|nr:LPS export ABC transporter permease LptG [Beijerinckiaceae bacterium]
MTFLVGTLGRYFALRFAKAILGVFLTVFILIFTLDLVELMRRSGEAPNATTLALTRLALLRTPATAEQILPFAALFGALATFLNLSRRLELVVARAAGVSAWQFSLPGIIVAALIGLLATVAYNPLATHFRARAEAYEASLFSRGGVGGNEKGVWLRQRSVDGETILRAARLDENTFSLVDVTAFSFDPNGKFMERIEGQRAIHLGNHWRFENVRVLTVDNEPQQMERYLLATSVSREQLRGSVGQSQAVSFWALPSVVRGLELAGLDATRYRLRFQSLLARPALLTAMVLVAASVSLRFLRSGGFAGMVLSGVSAGFVLYVATQIVEDLGSAGLVSTVFAAWAAPVIGGMLGSLALLHREDG